MGDSAHTCYAKVGGDHIAYQVVGDRSSELVFVPQWNTNVEALWDFAPLARFVRRLAGFSRVILFDKRGTGLSDSLSEAGQAVLEQFADDLSAVLDDVRAERVTLVAGDASALVAIVFAASHPERVSGLILVNAFAGFADAHDPSDERPVGSNEDHA